MLQFVLWPILAVWMGLAVLITLGIVAMLVWGTAHQLKDEAGEEGEVWCPVLQQTMKVKGISRHTTALPEFADLKRCEHWGNGRVGCAKACLEVDASKVRAA